MSSPEIFFAHRLDYVQTRIQEQTQGFDTEVIDEHPFVERAAVQHIENAIAGESNGLITVIFNGEPGSMKGSVAGQLGQRLVKLRDQQLEQNGHSRKSLRLHYISTAGMVMEGIRRGIQQSPYGSGSAEEVDAITRAIDEGLRVAEREIPNEYPDAINVLWEEFVGILDEVNAGTTIVRRQGQQPETLVFFIASRPEIQEQAYSLRKKLAKSSQYEQQVLKLHHSILDIAPDQARETMSTHRSIEYMTRAVNQAMYKAWEREDFSLPTDGPNKVPWEILRERQHDPRQWSGRALKRFFEELTIFKRGKMHTNPIRPYLQVGFYEHQALSWGILNSNVVLPEFVEGDIHGYMGFLKRHEIPVGKHIDQAKRLKREGDIYAHSASI